MYVKGECMCVRVKIYVCERRMYVCERRMYVCERARMNYILYGPSYAYKQAYQCMKKTGIQMYEKNILMYWSGGQPITAPRENGGTVPCSRAPQL